MLENNIFTKKWLEEHTKSGTQIKYDEKTGVYDLFGLSEIITHENFPSGIKIGYCTIVNTSNITTFKDFPKRCDYIKINDSDITSFEGCPADPNKIVISCSNIKSLDGLPKYVDYMSIGGNKQHFHAKDIYRKTKKYVKEVIDAAKEDCGGTLHRTTKTIFKY